MVSTTPTKTPKKMHTSALLLLIVFTVAHAAPVPREIAARVYKWDDGVIEKNMDKVGEALDATKMSVLRDIDGSVAEESAMPTPDSDYAKTRRPANYEKISEKRQKDKVKRTEKIKRTEKVKQKEKVKRVQKVKKEDDDSCFPASALVYVHERGLVNMSHLNVGDMVEVAPGRFSPVLLFSHRSADAVSAMIRIDIALGTSRSSITLSPGHYLYKSDGHLVSASQVRVGDALTSGTVQALTLVHGTGLFAPHTSTGTLLVQSAGESRAVLASAYTTAVHPNAAHAAIAPLRALHAAYGIKVPAVSALMDQYHNVAAYARTALRSNYLQNRSTTASVQPAIAYIAIRRAVTSA